MPTLTWLETKFYKSDFKAGKLYFTREKIFQNASRLFFGKCYNFSKIEQHFLNRASKYLQLVVSALLIQYKVLCF